MYPYFTQSNICYLFSVNDEYIPYLSVAIMSLISNSSQKNKYDICVLHKNISKQNIKKIENFKQKNISIRFIDMSTYLADIDENILTTHWHFTKETYYRFYIANIFQDYEKVIYLDCDILINTDIHELSCIDLEGYPIAAVEEFRYKCTRKKDLEVKNYTKNILKLKLPENYFNAGVLLIDLHKIKAMNFTKKCLDTLKEIKKPRNVDQCVLNVIFNTSVKLIDARWNVQTHVHLEDLKKYANDIAYDKYCQSLLNPSIVHYCSHEKPWNTKNIKFATEWWSFAKKSYYFDKIMAENKRNT